MQKSSEISGNRPDAVLSPIARLPRLTWVLVAGIFVLILLGFFALRWPFRNVPFERDEGMYAYAADRMAHGDLLYRDVFVSKLPGVYVSYWLSFKAFGRSIAAPRHLATLFTFGSILSVFLLLRQTHNAFLGLAGAALLAVSMFGTMFGSFTANTEIFMILPASLSVLFLWRGVKRNSWTDFLIAGVLSGLAMIVKQVAFTSLAFALLVALVSAWHGGARRCLSHLGSVILGAAMPVVICFAWFWMAGSLRQLVDSSILFNWHYFTMPWNMREERLLRGFANAIEDAPLLWLLGAWGLLRCFLLRKKRDWLLAGWLLFSILGICGAGTLYPHYFVQAVPALAAVAAVGLYIVPARRSGFLITVAGVTVCVVFAVVMQWPYLTRYTLEEVSWKCFPGQPFGFASKIGAYLKEHTSPDDKLFIFGSEPQIYFHAQRRCAVRYSLVYPLTDRSPDALLRQQEVVQALRQNPPRYLLIVGFDGSVTFKPGASRDILKELGSMITESYYLDAFTISVGRQTQCVFGRGEVEQHWAEAGGGVPGASLIYLFRKRAPGEDFKDPFPWLFARLNQFRDERYGDGVYAKNAVCLDAGSPTHGLAGLSWR